MARLVLTEVCAEGLQDVERAYAVGKYFNRVRQVFDPARHMRPRKVFRDHTAEWNDVVGPRDTKYREALDLLLGGISALHIGGVGSNGCELGPAAAKIAWLLNKGAVQDYYEQHYPFAPAILARLALERSLPEGYAVAWSDGINSPSFQPSYRRLLHLDARFIANDAIGDFIALVDDYYVHGDHISDLHAALQTPDRLARWLTKESRWRLMDGMEAFFELAIDLDAFLQSTKLPILRGQAWLHFAYWFGSGGDRMLEVANWLAYAADKLKQAVAGEEAETIGREAANAEASKLIGVLERLLDPNIYPLALLQLADDALNPWLKNSGAAKRLKQFPRWQLD